MSERRALSRQRQFRRRRTIAVVLGLLLIAAIVAVFAWVIPALTSGNDAASNSSTPTESNEPDPAASETPTEEPLTAAQELLASTDDPRPAR